MKNYLRNVYTVLSRYIQTGGRPRREMRLQACSFEGTRRVVKESPIPISGKTARYRAKVLCPGRLDYVRGLYINDIESSFEGLYTVKDGEVNPVELIEYVIRKSKFKKAVNEVYEKADEDSSLGIISIELVDGVLELLFVLA